MHVHSVLYLRKRASAEEPGSPPVPHPRIPVVGLSREKLGVLCHHDTLFEGLHLPVRGGGGSFDHRGRPTGLYLIYVHTDDRSQWVVFFFVRDRSLNYSIHRLKVGPAWIEIGIGKWGRCSKPMRLSACIDWRWHRVYIGEGEILVLLHSPSPIRRITRQIYRLSPDLFRLLSLT